MFEEVGVVSYALISADGDVALLRRRSRDPLPDGDGWARYVLSRLSYTPSLPSELRHRFALFRREKSGRGLANGCRVRDGHVWPRYGDGVSVWDDGGESVRVYRDGAYTLHK